MRNIAYVQQRKEQTVCEHCGEQPIEYHHPEHTLFPHRRLCQMMNGSSLAAIDAEIARCQALCRRCHMQLDGRLAHLPERSFRAGVASGKARRAQAKTDANCRIIGVK